MYDGSNKQALFTKKRSKINLYVKIVLLSTDVKFTIFLMMIHKHSSLPVVVTQSDERHATDQLLCWSGVTDTEHTTSGSDEQDIGMACYPVAKKQLQKI